jgi:D-alanyl-D-alanine carboxypeptidase
MRRAIGAKSQSASRVGRRVRAAAGLALLCTLAACGSQSTQHGRYNPTHYYPPPGPPSDPWGPYIREASSRFSVPERWIRKVMHQESGGQEDVISWAGAMGLMQVMPDTYNGLRARYDLGADPYDPHNNILAGTAYIKEMYDVYGAPGFLAAYNAGPHRLDRYLNNGTPLPEETVQYVAAIAPQLGPETVMSGPLAVYGGGASARYAVARRSTGGCDPDAAYDPSRPCAPAGARAAAPVAVAYAAPAPFVPGPAASATGCDPDAAYDPTRPCRPAPVQTASLIAPAPFVPGPPASATGCDPDAAYDPSQRCRPAPVVMTAAAAPVSTEQLTQRAVVSQSLVAPPPPRTEPAPLARGFLRGPAEGGAAHRPMQEAMTQRATSSPPIAAVPPPPGAWGIQVGAFASLSTAEAAAQSARAAAPDLLRTTKIELPATTPFGSQVAFRARLVGLSQTAAADACTRLSGHGMACLTVPPSHTSS